MSNKNIKEALSECSTITSDIMDKIYDKLNSEFTNLSYHNQEIILKDTNKDEVTNSILDIDVINKNNIKLLLQITESNNKIFIRQKFI